MYGSQFVDLAYENNIGYFITDLFFTRPWFSRLLGGLEDSHFSARKIAPFVAQYGIDMNDYEPSQYQSFNQFFIRKFKAGKRNFKPEANVFCAGAEARYYGFENFNAGSKVQVKGIDVTPTELVGNAALGAEFNEGTILIARLCPTDYHRFHFPVSGKLIHQSTVHGQLHSVNPTALRKKPDVFLKNERHVSIIENPVFGKIAMIEVGAIGVGKIIQSCQFPDSSSSLLFEKGSEKGYFLFGGSTVIWLLQKGKISLSSDLRENSIRGLETWIPLGDSLGEHRGS